MQTNEITKNQKNKVSQTTSRNTTTLKDHPDALEEGDAPEALEEGDASNDLNSNKPLQPPDIHIVEANRGLEKCQRLLMMWIIVK